MKRKVPPKVRKGMRTVSYGLAGNITGTIVGSRFGHPKTGSRIGTGIGLAAGSAIETKFKKGVPTQTATTGGDKFQSRVGTKTNGRVRRKDISKW